MAYAVQTIETSYKKSYTYKKSKEDFAERGDRLMKGTKRSVAPLVPVLILALVLMSLVAACGEEATTTTTAPGTETTAPAEETTTTVAGAEDTGQTFELKFSYPTPSRASLVGAYLQPWTSAITEATDGRVTVTHYGESSLVKEEQQWDALLSGTSDIALIEPEFNAGAFPISEVGSLPMLFPSAEMAAKVYWDIVQEYCQNEWKDVQVLAVAVISGAQYAGNKEIKAPQDLKGLRMRSGGKVETWILETLGATPVEISTGDLGTSMERGLADGAFLSWSLIMTTGVKDVTEYRTECDLFYRCWVIAMNKDKWESMPATVQQAIMDVSGPENSATYTIANEEETQGTKKGLEGSDKGAGNPPIYVLSAEEKAQWQEALKPVWDKWVQALGSDKPGQEVIDKIGELVERYSAQ